MAFTPTPDECDPKKWNPDQQQAWNAHVAEQATRGLNPFPPDQFMLVHHSKFGLDEHGAPKVVTPPAPQG